MASKRKKPVAAKGGIGRYKLLVAAITLFWAAVNEPPALNVGPVIVWVLSALAVALLACALLALMAPAMIVLMRLFSRRQMQIKPETDEA
jgi:hypothetical protein